MAGSSEGTKERMEMTYTMSTYDEMSCNCFFDGNVDEPVFMYFSGNILVW